MTQVRCCFVVSESMNAVSPDQPGKSAHLLLYREMPNTRFFYISTLEMFSAVDKTETLLFINQFII